MKGLEILAGEATMRQVRTLRWTRHQKNWGWAVGLVVVYGLVGAVQMNGPPGLWRVKVTHIPSANVVGHMRSNPQGVVSRCPRVHPFWSDNTFGRGARQMWLFHGECFPS